MKIKQLIVVVLILISMGILRASQHGSHTSIGDPLNTSNDPKDGPIVSGKSNPELIPLGICYNTFFRLLAQEQLRGPGGKIVATAICKNMGLTEKSTNSLLQLALEYDADVAVIDQQAIPLKESYRLTRSTSTSQQLQTLQTAKEKLALGLINRCVERLGFVESQRVLMHIESVVRKNITLTGATATRVLNSRTEGN